jgi:uncharacterized membrane protein
MVKFTQTSVINAPVEKLFDYMDDPNNLPLIWPNLVSVSDVGRMPNGGARFKYVYAMAGIRSESLSEDIEYVQNVRTVTKSSGGVDSTATVEYEPVEAGTRVTISNEFVVPVPLVGKLAESVIAKMAEQDAQALLVNLKTRMEA